MSLNQKNNDFAPGSHILLDFFDSKNTSDTHHIKQALELAANECNATILNISLHDFGENSGVTGVALLAESHISIHTWPENGFIALDVFMCGSCDASNAIEPLKKMFSPKKVNIKEIKRGHEQE